MDATTTAHRTLILARSQLRSLSLSRLSFGEMSRQTASQHYHPVGNGHSYQQEDGRSGSPAPPAATPRSLATILADKAHVFAAFGLWAPVYIIVFTLSCFLLAFAMSVD